MNFLSGIFGGGSVDFAGISDFNGLQQAVRDYHKGIQQIVDDYNPDAKINSAFRGDVETALKTFVSNTKQLLDAYVTLTLNWVEELDKIKEDYTGQSGVGAVASDVQDAASDVLAKAQDVSLD